MRPAVSMIELIFAIVVIGIAIMTVPAMLTQSSKAVLISTQQEAILAGTTKMGNILSHAWDVNQTDGVRNGGYAKVVRASNGDSALDVNTTTLRRVGHFEGDRRRRGYSDVGSTNAQITNVGNRHIDGFIGSDTLVVGGGGGDYLRGYDTNTTVYFISDNASYGDVNISIALSDTVAPLIPTNIKFINTIVTDTDGDDDVRISLFAFSSNVGQTGLLQRAIYE